MDGMHMNSTGDNPIEIDFENYANHMNKFLMAHIICMIIAYVFILPAGIVLAMAKSKAHIPVQIVYVILTLIGYIFAHISHHKASPENYYKGNIHRPVGRFFMWITFLIAIVGITTSILKKRMLKEYQPAAEAPGAMEDPEQALQRNSLDDGAPLLPREGNSSDEYLPPQSSRRDVSSEKPSIPSISFINIRSWRTIPKKWCVLQVLRYFHRILGHLWLYVGFFESCTGIVLLAGIFKGQHIFNGLAHWIKGAIFLWYGILSFGEYLGAFSEYGWAWNVVPKQLSEKRFAKYVPTKEMVESFLLFAYGVSNVWLEHLGNTDGKWNHHDLQHASLAFMLWWAGLCGILVESKVVHRLLNATLSATLGQRRSEDSEHSENGLPSYNVFPALTVFFTGIMMSAHDQTNHVSTVIHVLWGRLLAAAAIARICTYIMLYLKPPSSPWPTRPPTEIITSFCLICGGAMFMASSYDVVNKIRLNEMSPMLIMNISVAFTCIVMGLEVMFLILKGYASSR
ncbi:hypothetical protein POMI540_4298 [Schizosaccharomyces pombe]|uniref:Uncharacterized membrane protein C3B8.06 n=1 Tax=Schizosaccharomyces pombe (strain 972 / ATCC 24843) TaxID=284812 RepID=YBH6_SCHPO|nr:uncharacterized protein SPBC3B8.06 [Schizosaccharomyces pombe]O59714.1 RecName: Full=Uncharacterized membrane protein C3B8.06 [Schizosaccharomyces pombe 972h-]CAA18295.1 conserved fungal protein [Schizosaccharomyces pombe]|eukprot:NP_001342718.1 uncharacterized protein SPBC3B8.06 [Schizosaccharomyces pombe]